MPFSCLHEEPLIPYAQVALLKLLDAGGLKSWWEKPFS